MKKDIHPDNYRLVVFKDTSCDYAFLTKSTVETKETIKWDDGKEYPLCKIEISNKSHPFFTGKQNLVDTAGRIEKFNQKYGRKYNSLLFVVLLRVRKLKQGYFLKETFVDKYKEMIGKEYTPEEID